ncbi:Repeat domain-containing protein [Nannocystis exedens]|uniref:Repeat domain-containing protein n=1 Tax=Nannocystis exedens TaxID=54 RepID=A0A1I2GSJ8_9BACT|nr:FG-GAP-like repeat-containing protein [Nannocystis exedens]PCC68796.1 FG-GAP repeat protein [Nannocystis exedens]SFF20163.1 Repeat domain-containing protein [Nannocystis exedens]
MYLVKICLIAAIAPACERADEAADDETTFEEFRDATERSVDYPQLFVVEGDMLMSEDQLRSYFDRRIQPRAYSTKGTDGHNAAWRVDRKLTLTYCVDAVTGDANGGFTPAEHALVVAAMKQASLEWELAGDVNFIHRPSADTGDCDFPSADVYFTVEKSAATGCGMNAFGPGGLAQPDPIIRVVTITQDAVDGCNDPLSATFTLLEGLRHELGHVIGLEHEHYRNTGVDNPRCDDTEFVNFQKLSEIDPASVMWYDFCDGGEGTHSSLTRRDAAAARFLYNLPKSGWLRTSAAGPALPQWANYDSNARSDIFWYAPGGPEQFSFSQGGGAFTLSNSLSSAPLAHHKPLVGQYDSGSLSDVLLHTQGPNASEETLFLKQANNLSFTASALSLSDSLVVPLVGQFAGTDRTDILFFGVTGGLIHWVSNGNGTFTEHTVFVPIIGEPTRWYSPVAGDFDGDGFTDIFAYHSDVDTNVSPDKSKFWRSLGNGTFTSTDVNHTAKGIQGSNTSPFFYAMTVGDFNGNGPQDILWYSPTAPGSNVVIWRNGASMAEFVASQSLAGKFKVFSGDFNGDATTDVFWYNQNEGPSDHDIVWLQNGDFSHTGVTVDVGNNELLPVLGDYDNNGTTDIYWWDPVGTDRVWISDGDGTFTETSVASDPTGYPVGYGLQ